MDLSTKFFLGIAVLVAAIYVRRRLSQWFANLNETARSWIFVGPVIGLSLIEILGDLPKFSIGNSILIFIAFAVLWGIVWFILFGASVADRSPSGKAGGYGYEKLSTFDSRSPSKDFADVDGMHDLKTQLLSQANEIMGGNKNGILFHGAPGNGKTMIAEAFAGEINKLLPKKKKAVFMPVSMAAMASRWMNQTTEQLNDLFTQAHALAEKNGACILFIDEIDSLLVSRESANHISSEVTQQVTAMLTLLVDNRDFTQSGIIIVAATNYLDNLDAAAIREGRFDFKTEIKAPDFEARTSLLINTALAAKLSRSVAERAAIRWEGFGVARIRHVGELAAKMAAAAGRDEVTFDDLMAALRDAQGCKGSNLPENTASLDQLSFDLELTERLKQLSRRMTKIADIEAIGGTVPKGVLFYGPPGTGKTAVAKALAISSGWAFQSTTGQKLINDSNEFDKLITKASDLRPCIVFIDEADDILADRSNNPHSKSATNNLLALMDGDRALKDVLFVAATNFEDSLDAAAVRGGRFAEHFEFKRPDENALVSILRSFMNEKSSAPWSADFTPDAAANILNGLSPADAKDRVQKAINRVVSKLDGSQITLEDLRAIA